MKLSLVMPAYNEQNTLRQIVEKVCEALKDVDFELIIVNDGSKDETEHIAHELEQRCKQVKLINNPMNMGKSQTVKHGIAATTGDIVVVQDADLEYDPQDLLMMLEYFQKHDLDVLYGNRFGYKNEVVYWQNWFGNTFLSFISSLFTGVRANMWPRDMEVCYKMAKGDLFRKVGATITATSNFGVEPEITAKFSKVKGVKFAQVPIRYYPRTVAEGKKIKAIADGYKALKEILRYNLTNR